MPESKSASSQASKNDIVPLATEDQSTSETTLLSCGDQLSVSSQPHHARYGEFILFPNAQDNGSKEPTYLILQPHKIIENNNQTSSSADQLAKKINENVSNINAGQNAASVYQPKSNSDIPTPASQPAQNAPSVAKVLEIVQKWKDVGSDGAKQIAQELTQLVTTNQQKQAQPNQVLVASNQQSISFEPLPIDFSKIKPTTMYSPYSKEAINEYIKDMLTPEQYQPLSNPNPHFALYVMYEQEWKLKGYSRGELIGSTTLAPGEELTLEFHSWDKSTVKSEEELASESETRVSENLTERDVLSVSREVSREKNTSLSFDGSIKNGVGTLGINVTGSKTESLRETFKNSVEKTTEKTIQSSNTLKISRKTRIEIARETGKESRQTRVIKNTNRCHTLNCHYFEILSNYEVTTKIKDITPCVLLPYPKEEITPQWTLSYEDILKKVLLDKTFFEAFDAARLLRTNEVFIEVKEERLKDVSSTEISKAYQKKLRANAIAIVTSFNKLTTSKYWIKFYLDRYIGPNTGLSGLGSMGLGLAVWYTSKREDIRHTFYLALLATNKIAWNALTNLQAEYNEAVKNNVAEDDAAWGEMIRNFFASARPHHYKVQMTNNSLINGLVEIELHESLAHTLRILYPSLTPDDAGLYNAIRAAYVTLQDALEAILESDGSPSGSVSAPAYSLMDIAQARVKFEQFKAHVEHNWVHYMQSIWAQEHSDQRMMRLQTFGPIATIIRNELLGFYGDKAAFPVTDIQALKNAAGVDFIAEIIKNMIDDTPKANPKEPTVKSKAIDDTNSELPQTPVLITLPTHGSILEAMIGGCDACEDYINQSRVYDLNLQKAKSEQEQAEANRRQKRIEANDLSYPGATVGGKVEINIDTEKDIEPTK